MKRLAVLFAIVTLGIINTFGQGQIVFGNTTAGSGFKMRVITPSTTQTVGTACTVLGPGSVRIVLLVGDLGDTISQMVPVASVTSGATMVTNALTTTALSQGTFSGGTPTFSMGWDTVNKPAIQFAYVAWDIASGITSYSSLFSGDTFTGGSATFVTFTGIITGYQPGFSTATAPQTFGTGAFQIPHLDFIIPEPSTFAIAGLSAAGWLIIRRRFRFFS